MKCITFATEKRTITYKTIIPQDKRVLMGQRIKISNHLKKQFKWFNHSKKSLLKEALLEIKNKLRLSYEIKKVE